MSKEKVKKFINGFLIGIVLIIPFFVYTKSVNATSGACSWHNGVNCNAGRQYNGKIICNDGWTESITEYDFMKICEGKSNLEIACKGITSFNWRQYQKDNYNKIMIFFKEVLKLKEKPEQEKLGVSDMCEKAGIPINMATLDMCLKLRSNEIKTKIEQLQNYIISMSETFYQYTVSDTINKCLDIQEKIIDAKAKQILGVNYSNPLNLKSGWLIKNKKFVEVFYVDSNLCLHWIVNEQAAFKYFGITWNYEGNIKEFNSIPQGYKFCGNLE